MSSTLSKPGPEAEVIAIACDHAGYQLKTEVIKLLNELGVPVDDLGCSSPDEAVHYPVFGKKVVDRVLSRPHTRGILICGTGLGMSILANRFPGIRAALCHDVSTAIMSRRHNDANLLVLGGRMIGPQLAREIVRAWLTTPFEGGRHQNRLDLLEKLVGSRPEPDR
jgi:ribose 5-phosphate isomerase B|uniref:Ribose 5-phosphate isomerase B n=1 Tax=Desulfobacca acetoxidans TaxID=60893 RepID=A0A7C3UWA9_9BACT